MIEEVRIKPQECIVYLEVYEKAGDGIVDAYIDFRQRKDLVLFSRATNFDNNSKATFIELCGLKSAKRLRRGCYYKLNLDIIKNYQIARNENSLIIGGSYDLGNMQMPTGDNEEVLQSHEALNHQEMSEANVPRGTVFDNRKIDNLKLFVKDVGQANWNELRSGNLVKVVYDAGAELHASPRDVRNIIASRKKDLMHSKPVLVLSHWDMDHIHCLKEMNVNEIRACFSKIVCPDKLKSLASKDVLRDFKTALGVANVYCLPLPGRTNGITMHHWRREGCVSIYRAESSSQINYCGLVMFVCGGKRSANYTGDCKLIQAKDVYDQEKAHGLLTKGHVLVAPHHGGDYGAKNRLYSLPCDHIVISVGANNGYGHPQPDMLRYLGRLGNVEQTKDVGDIEKDL